jgi:hypothetical protein
MAASFAVALLCAALAACGRPVVAVVLDPLFAAAAPEAAAALSGFRLPGARTVVTTLDPRSPDVAAAVFDAAIVLASPLALSYIAELPAGLLPPSVLAVDAPVPRELADRARVASFDRAGAWTAAGELFGSLSASGEAGVAAVLLVEGPSRSAARAADFERAYERASGRVARTSVLPVDSGQAAFDTAIAELLRLDLRFAVVAAGARTPEAVRRLAGAGVVVASELPVAEAAFTLEDDWVGALALLAKGAGAPVVPSRLAPGPGLASAVARLPSLGEASRSLPRAR